jgi:TatD DNase family protein
MELIDTHAHLASGRLRGETDLLLRRAAAEEVRHIVSIGTDLEDSAANVVLAAAHPEIHAAVGIHPTSVHEIPDEGWLDTLRALATRPQVVALGEMGLDHHHPPQDGSPVAEWHARQIRVFTAQLDLAEELGLPVIIHQRESSSAVLALMRERAGKLRAVFHCFTGSADEARLLIDLGFHVSFTGVVTYKNAADVAACAAALPLDRVMIETDCPYLAPVPHRGGRNEPAYLRHTAAFLAERRGLSLEAFASATSATARDFFRLDPG